MRVGGRRALARLVGGSRLTGERPVPGATPDSLLALHAAGYREVAQRLGHGYVLDAGCGLGFETLKLAGDQRRVVAVDRDLGALCSISSSVGVESDLQLTCSDAALLGLRSRSFDYVCSSHLIEHFDTPARHVAELARVLKPGGQAFVLTPNAPWDFENPFHLALFRPAELSSLLSEYFAEVWVGALEGSTRVHDDFAERRATARRLLSRVDPLDLRHRLPRKWWVAAYSVALPVSYRLFAREQSGGASGITAEDYFVTGDVQDETPVLFAIAGSPRGQPLHGSVVP